MEAFIVGAVRSAGGKRKGRLAGWHPADLAGAVLKGLIERVGADPLAVEDVIMGCACPGGEQGANIGRRRIRPKSLGRN
jgi:acetyl-CoA C-acetyltransferase